MSGWTFCDVQQSRAGHKGTQENGRSELLWTSLLVFSCHHFFANFHYVRWLIHFARCRTEQSRPVGNVRDQENGRFELLWTYCLYFLCHHFLPFFAKNVAASCQFKLDFKLPWEFYCSFDLKNSSIFRVQAVQSDWREVVAGNMKTKGSLLTPSPLPFPLLLHPSCSYATVPNLHSSSEISPNLNR